jgi:hypothetical protein
LDRLRGLEANVEPFLAEFRETCAKSDGSLGAMPRIAWTVVAREFGHEPLTIRIWHATALLFLATWPSSEPQIEEVKPPIMAEYFDGQCSWLWAHRNELFTPAEIEVLKEAWEDVRASRPR